MRLLVFAVLGFVACSKPVTSSDVCQKLVSAGVAANCRASTPGGLGARASESTDFDLPSVPEHGGRVFGFASSDDYAATVKAFEAAATLAGPWRFGNEKARVFVQMNDGAKPDVGSKAKAVVDGI